ncbi:MAG: hypothetical protein EPN82_05835 [Bacteroidetes bacterium]|nr:MAG: hypothetical protein EPN82_05835 [Bacteroidota bacterium]
MAKKKTRVFTKVNSKRDQIEQNSSDKVNIPIEKEEQLLEEMKKGKDLFENMVMRYESVVIGKKRIIELFAHWDDIMEFLLTPHNDVEPVYNKQMTEIGEAMAPLYYRAKELLTKWGDINFD